MLLQWNCVSIRQSVNSLHGDVHQDIRNVFLPKIVHTITTNTAGTTNSVKVQLHAVTHTRIHAFGTLVRKENNFTRVIIFMRLRLGLLLLILFVADLVSGT